MKKLFLLTLLGLSALTVAAQMTRKPVFRPDWVFEAPRPGNATYLYVVEHGEGNTKREALNQALGRVFQSTANRIGQAFSTDEVNRAVQSGTDFEVIARNMKVPINKVCEFPVQDTLTNSWTMYVLCQVAKAGNITPEFEATDECTKHTRFDGAMQKWMAQQKDKEKEQQKAIRKKNGQAFAASMERFHDLPGFVVLFYLPELENSCRDGVHFILGFLKFLFKFCDLGLNRRYRPHPRHTRHPPVSRYHLSVTDCLQEGSLSQRRCL